VTEAQGQQPQGQQPQGQQPLRLPPLPDHVGELKFDPASLLESHAAYGRRLHRLIREKAEAEALERRQKHQLDDVLLEAEVRLRRRNGWSYEAIAAEFGSTSRRVRRFCQARGIGKYRTALENDEA
jgi:hypothetical protein